MSSGERLSAVQSTNFIKNNINRQFHLMNSVRRVSGGWIQPEPECSYVEVLSTLDIENFDEELERVVESQVAGSSKDLGELWAECSNSDGIKVVSSLWHRKATFTGICLARFPLSSGTYCRVAVVSTYIINNATVVAQGYNYGDKAPLPGCNHQSHLSHQRFRVVHFADDLMLVTIKRFCQFVNQQVSISGTSGAIPATSSIPSLAELVDDENAWAEIEHDIEAFNKKPQSVELILCLDGGGTRGFLAASILKRLFARFPDVDITTVFDRFYGTSAGAIAAATLWSGAFTCETLQEKFQQISARIFPKERHNHTLLDQISGNERYKSKDVDLVIFKHLSLLSLSPSSVRMQKIMPELIIHATDASSVPLRPKVYRSSSSAYSTLGMSVRASVAAPTYIPPMIVRRETETYQSGSDRGNAAFLNLIDGGIFNNDPTGSALADHFQNPPADSKRTVIISIGTGCVEEQRTMNFSSISAVPEMIATSSNFEGLLNRQHKKNKQDSLSTRYIRMQPFLEKAKLDSIDAETFRMLDRAVDRFPASEPVLWSEATKAIEDCIASGICEERQRLKQRVVDHMFTRLKTCHERMPLVFEPCALALPPRNTLFAGPDVVSMFVHVEQIVLRGAEIERVVRFVANGNVIAFRDAWCECPPRNYCLTDGFFLEEHGPSRYRLISVRYPQKALGLKPNGLVLVERTQGHVFPEGVN